MTTRREVGILIAGASKLQTPNHFLSNSGVVASAIAYGNSFEAARSQAYALAETFNGFHYRDDIGLRLDVPEVYRS
jgi:phosphoribosylamine-glycine ligase